MIIQPRELDATEGNFAILGQTAKELGPGELDELHALYGRHVASMSKARQLAIMEPKEIAIPPAYFRNAIKINFGAPTPDELSFILEREMKIIGLKGNSEIDFDRLGRTLHGVTASAGRELVHVAWRMVRQRLLTKGDWQHLDALPDEAAIIEGRRQPSEIAAAHPARPPVVFASPPSLFVRAAMGTRMRSRRAIQRGRWRRLAIVVIIIIIAILP